jgi:aspartyl-tRNA(Asn)/glutamyl-tRNA(Gln) amidotransferase subunit A
LRASKVRTLIRRDYEQAFTRCDALVTPTAPTPAFRIGEVTSPLAMYALDIFTLPPSLAGVPAISTPIEASPSGLPIGIQLVGPHFAEARLVRIAHALEQSIPRRPLPALPGEAS